MMSRRFGATLLRTSVIRPPIVRATRGIASPAHVKEKLPTDGGKNRERFREFSLAGKVFAVTGGARGLGLSMAEALVEAGGEGIISLCPKAIAQANLFSILPR
jgi:hypothetical protein